MNKGNKYKEFMGELEEIKHKMSRIKLTLFSKSKSQNERTYYSDLMPKDELNGGEEYHKALDWAIRKNKKIKNIALSGPYGAGKSTIIESYIKKAKIKKNKLLQISLATFDFKDDENKCDSQIIEKRILEQIIYRVDGKKTPFSRFKKISKVHKKTVWKNVILLVLLLLSGYLLFHMNTAIEIQEYLNNLRFQDILPLLKKNWLSTATYLIFGITLIFMIYCLTNLAIKSFKITKIKFNKMEIEVDKKSEESIYNKYLDELLYFFEETKYEFVIFEDIDRFENPEVFTNLREVNNFLNNYEKIKRRIVFLYAIKDDMFSDKERTKFFDFIIPVIPFVDAYNSRQIVLNKFEEVSSLGIKKPSERLIKDITIYLDDMRMLTNIINEYVIYYKQINNKEINADKLFSIIVYKNLLPNDFHDLQYNRGIVKRIFDKKDELIEKYTKELEEKIKHTEKLIEISDTTFISNIEDLISIYMKHWKSRGISQIYIGNGCNDYIYLENCNIASRKEEFEPNQQVKVRTNNYVEQIYSYDEFFSAFGVYNNLFLMAEAIELKNKEELVKRKEELKEHINRKNELRLTTLKNLAKHYDYNEISREAKQHELVVFLIREGYIDESYRHYISYFHPGAISNRDMLFLRSIKNRSALFKYNDELDNVGEIIKEISDEELKSEVILNNYLLDYLISNLSNERGRFDVILRELIKNIDTRIEFIDQFCNVSINKNVFINEICKEYHDFWHFIFSKSKFDNEKVDKYFIYVMNSCEVSDILALNEDESIKKYIEGTPHIFQLPYEADVEDKFKDIFNKLNIKFSMLNKPNKTLAIDGNVDIEDTLLKHILYNSQFNINESMIRYFYGYFINYNNEEMVLFERKNYSAIKLLNEKSLLNYIDKNLVEYLENVFLKLNNNSLEELSIIENFLNNEEINLDIKRQIIFKSSFLIEKLKRIPDNLWDTVVQFSKWDITWVNIISYFDSFKELSDDIIVQLNKRDVYEKLSMPSIDKSEGTEAFSQEILESLYQYLYENEDLNDESFKEIQRAIPIYFDYAEDKLLSHRRIELILDGKSMEFTTDNLYYMKKHYSELFYKWTYSNIDKFIENIQDIQLDVEDIRIYLEEFIMNKSTKVNLVNSKKELILDNLDNEKLLESIFNLNEKEIINNMDISIVEALIECEGYFEDRVYLLGNIIDNLSKDDIGKYLSKFGEPLNLLFEKRTEEYKDLLIHKSKVTTYILERLVKCNYLESFKESREGYSIMFSQEEEMVKD